jgi:D-aminoacyl-tRNA deacylase|tara:strand:- start:1012 stop:1809 length:798 start_codon:yes stop_codon:yes gene_type:complete
MFEKYLVVASKKDLTGTNITTHLSQFQTQESKFDFYLVEDEIIFARNLDTERINKYDFIIFASRHKSTKEEKTLSIHPVGNFREAEFGGEKGKLGRSSALFQKQLFESLNANAKRFDLKNYDITLESTHHGPLIDKPCVFIEIGSTEREYKDRRAAFVIAKAISEAIEEFKENPYNEVAIGIGGPHYCPSFNKIQLKSNIAVSHIIPRYAFPITGEMVKETIEKTHEEVDFALLDWKSLGNLESREEIIKVLEENYIQWKKTGDV